MDGGSLGVIGVDIVLFHQLISPTFGDRACEIVTESKDLCVSAFETSDVKSLLVELSVKMGMCVGFVVFVTRKNSFNLPLDVLCQGSFLFVRSVYV